MSQDESTIPRVSITDFAKRIKAKHPDYAEIDDNELTRKVLEKYPEYRNQIDTTPTDPTIAEGEVRQAEGRMKNAANAYTSAGGRALNPAVTGTSDYFRPLNQAERTAQQAGEPVVISQANQTEPTRRIVTAPTTAPPATKQPVGQSLSPDPISQDAAAMLAQQRARQRQIAQQRRLMQQRVETARIKANARNASQQLAGMQMDTNESGAQLPSLDKRVPHMTDFIQRAANTPKAQIKDQIRTRLKAEQAQRDAQAASGSEAQVLAQKARQGGYNSEKRELELEQEVEQNYQTFLRSQAPELIATRQQFGQLHPAVRSVVGPSQQFLGNTMKSMGELSSWFGFAPTEASDYLNTRGQAFVDAATMAPLDKEQKEIKKQFGEQFATGLANLGISITEIVALKRIMPNQSLGNIMGIETLLKTGDLPLEQRAMAVAQSKGMGTVLDQHLGRLVSAGIFGAPTAIEQIEPYKQGQISGTEALVNTGVQAGVGFVLGGKGAKAIPKETADYVIQSPLTPEPVRDVVARAAEYGTGLVKSEDGRNLSLYRDPQTGATVAKQITTEQAKKYDSAQVTGEKRPVRNTKSVTAEQYDDLLRSLGMPIEGRAKELSSQEKPENPQETAQNITKVITESSEKEVKQPLVTQKAVVTTQEGSPKTQVQASEGVAPAAPLESSQGGVVLPNQPAEIPESPPAEVAKFLPLEPAASLPAVAQDIVRRYDDTGELGSQGAVVDELEALDLLPELTAKYRAEQRSSREEYGERMDSEGELFEKEIEPALHKLAEGATPEAKPAAKPVASTVDIAPILKAKDLDELHQLGGSMLINPKNGGALAQIQKAMRDRAAELETASRPATEVEKQSERVSVTEKPLDGGGRSIDVRGEGVEKPKASDVHAAKIAELAPRLRALRESRNLADVQSILDDALTHRKEHGGNESINRLITGLRAESFRLRQPEIKEQPAVSPEAPMPLPKSKAGKKLLKEAQSEGGKTVRKKPTHAIGRPKSNSSVNSVSVEARALGGIRPTANFAGEVKRLAEIPGHRGLVNQTSGLDAERMVNTLAESGYRLPGVEFDTGGQGGFRITDVNLALEAIEDDARGIKPLHSTEHEFADRHPDEIAYEQLIADDYAQDLMAVLESGDARATDIAAFAKLAESHGLSDEGTNAAVKALSRTVQEELSGGVEEGYSLDEEGTLLDPDGKPLFAIDYQHGLPTIAEPWELTRSELSALYGSERGIPNHPREGPWEGDLPPVGSWRMDPLNGALEQLQRVPVEDLVTAEDETDRGIQESVGIYTQWAKQGKQAPPIDVVKHVKGHWVSINRRRLMAARRAGKDTILAWISDSGPTGRPTPTHEEVIKDAIARGEEVPARVLADYPDIAQPSKAEVDAALAEMEKPAYQRRLEAKRKDPEYRKRLESLGLTPDEIRIHLTPRGELNEVEQAVKKEVRSRVIKGQIAGLNKSLTDLVEDTLNTATEFKRKQDESALFARDFQQLGFMDEGLSMQEAPRKSQSEIAKENLKAAEEERIAAENPEKAKAVEKLAELKRRGLTIDEYARQHSMFEPAPSDAEIKLLREVAKGEKKAPVAQSDSLFARETDRLSTLHNLSEGNLKFADELGGLAVPSIAVVPEHMGMSGMGDITLIGTRELGDPSQEPIHDADVYSPTFPRPSYSPVPSAKAQTLIDSLKALSQEFQGGRRIIDETWDNMVNTPDPAKVIQDWLRSNAAKAMFLKEQNVEVKPIHRDVHVDFPWANDTEFKEAFRRLYHAIDDRDASERSDNPEIRELSDIARAAIRRYAATDPDTKKVLDAEIYGEDAWLQHYGSRWGETGEWVTGTDPMPWNMEYRIGESIRNAGKREVDETKTAERLDRKLKGQEAEFTQWVKDQIEPLFANPFIKTREGKKPYTLGNIVDVMSGRVRAQEESMTYGEGKARAAAARQFKDLEEMRRYAKTQIRPESEIKEGREEAKKLLADWRNNVVSYYGNRVEQGSSSEFGRVWEGLDASMKALARWARGGKTAQNMERALRREGFDVSRMPDYLFEDGVEAGKAFLQAPVPYFEAKPQRAVRLNEFAGAVIPKKASAETRALLDKHGIPYVEYNSGKGHDAQELATIKFRKKLAKDNADVLFAKGEAPTATGPHSFPVKDNTVDFGPRGAEIIGDIYQELGVLGKGQQIRGTFERQGEAMARNLEVLAKRGVEGAKQLAAAVKQAAEAGKGQVVMYYGQNAKFHELFHWASEQAKLSLKGRHAHYDALIARTDFLRAKPRLLNLGYVNDNAVLLEELAAHLAEGEHERMGMSLNEAKAFRKAWFESFIAKNGTPSPRQFEEMVYEAQQDLAEVLNARRNAAEGQINDQTVPRVSEGAGAGAHLARGPTKQTDTPEFKQWFGDSKVVDENGEPLVVYHTTDADFDKFAIGDIGFHFGDVAAANDRAAAWEGSEGSQARTLPVYLSLQNPLRINDVGGFYKPDVVAGELKAKGVLTDDEVTKVKRLIATGTETQTWDYLRAAIKSKGYDGLVYRNEVESGGNADSYIALSSNQIKSATGNRGTFDPDNPNILFARSEDPWERLAQLADELEARANEPELPEGQQPRSLPKTLEAAQMPKGDNLGYEPATFDEGETSGRSVLAEKGVDGAIEYVLNGKPGIDWAPTGFAALNEMESQERLLRDTDPEAAAALKAKIDKFAGDFSARATQLGQAIVSVKIIERFSPDRAAYELNKASMKARKKPASDSEKDKITALADELQRENDLLKQANRALEAKASTKRTKASTQPTKTRKTHYQDVLDEQASIVLQTLKPKVGKLDLTGIGRESERGAVQIGIPPLEGDAELLAQYAASQLGKLDTVADLNAHLLTEFGQDVAPYLPKIRQRAFAIRQEARLAEMEARETPAKRQKTILNEIQQEIAQELTAIRETQKAAAAALKAEKAAEARQATAEARLAAKAIREAEAESRKAETREHRARLKQVRQEYKAAREAETRGYRENLKARREAERLAGLWDTPLRNEAAAARERLKDATDPKDPQVMDDLVSVAVERFLPAERTAAVKTEAVDPAKLYVDLKAEFPDLVTRKTQGKILKRAFEKIEQVKAVARETARLRAAKKESKDLYEQGLDVEDQALLIQKAERQQKVNDLRSKMAAEFERVSTPLGKNIISWTIGTKANAFYRELMSSIDAPILRQGLYPVLMNPVRTLRAAIPVTARGYSAFTHEAQTALENDIRDHPRYQMAQELGLALTEVGGGGKDPELYAEELFASPVAEKLPHVRLSSQAYTSGMNIIRLTDFDLFATALEANGFTLENNREAFEDITGIVNRKTGRGNLPEWVKNATKGLNWMFFATRFGVSHAQFANDLLNPLKYIPARFNPTHSWGGESQFVNDFFKSYDTPTRNRQLMNLIRLGFAAAALYGLAKALGFDVREFPIIRLGNTRYDLSGGKVSAVKALMKVAEGVNAWAHGRPSRDIFAEAAHYGRGKLAPVPSMMVDTYYGKNVVRQPANFKIQAPVKMMQENILLQRLQPIIFGDFADAYADSGWTGLLKAVPGLTGMNVNTYPDRGTRAIHNKQVADAMEKYGITDQSLLGQQTKLPNLDTAITAKVMGEVEKITLPSGATDTGQEKILRDRLAQIRKFAKVQTALENPAEYAQYLRSQDAELDFLTDAEKAKLTPADVVQYRSFYADAYLGALQTVSRNPQYKAMDADKQEKVIDSVGRRASIIARAKMTQIVRPH